MIRIGICDDSFAFLQQAKFIIEHWDGYAKDIKTEVFEDADTLIHAHTKHPFDIILLDIVMPLLNGMDAAKEIREADPTVKIVFLTTTAEYAVDSYTVKASNYLLKPVEPAKLFDCLQELISDIESTAKCITVKASDATHRILLSNIEFVESQGKHIVFSMSDGSTLHSNQPLYTYENRLTLDDGFFKCHRSYIVNIDNVSSYTAKEIITRSGCRIPIARNSSKDFEAAYFTAVFGKAGVDEL